MIQLKAELRRHRSNHQLPPPPSEAPPPHPRQQGGLVNQSSWHSRCAAAACTGAAARAAAPIRSTAATTSSHFSAAAACHHASAAASRSYAITVTNSCFTAAAVPFAAAAAASPLAAAAGAAAASPLVTGAATAARSLAAAAAATSPLSTPSGAAAASPLPIAVYLRRALSGAGGQDRGDILVLCLVLRRGAVRQGLYDKGCTAGAVRQGLDSRLRCAVLGVHAGSQAEDQQQPCLRVGCRLKNCVEWRIRKGRYARAWGRHWASCRVAGAVAIVYAEAVDESGQSASCLLICSHLARSSLIILVRPNSTHVMTATLLQGLDSSAPTKNVLARGRTRGRRHQPAQQRQIP